MATTTIETKPKKSSQEAIEEFWKSNLATLKPNPKAPSILPPNVYEQLVGKKCDSGPVQGRPVTASYEEAVKECEAKVAQIVAECKQTNTKYTDPYFDLDDSWFCIYTLSAPPPIFDNPVPAADNEDEEEELGAKLAANSGRWRGVSGSKNKPFQMPAGKESDRGLGDGDDKENPYDPACAKRIDHIFDDPHFFIAGASTADIRQGSEGDCWFLSSLGSLCVESDTRNSLIERICPENARDEMCGVYGFVFNRDGEWVSEVVDDKLYLKAPDYDDGDVYRRRVWDMARFRAEPNVSREEYRRTFQSNSDALWFGSCADPNETWVPLIEKAFAKAHGDYRSINGGWPGEGLEDLTGGITTKIVPANILDKDRLWSEGFMKVTKEFLFGVGTRYHSAWWDRDRQGIQDTHAYSVLRAVEYKGTRLLQVKNPWGRGEWNGPWSDGSKEWTPEAMQTLNHTFGNEGIFWMTYRDFLLRYSQIWQTRLFGPDWTVSQYWTTVNVPWFGDYNDCSFEFSIPMATHAVVVLSQLDERYWRGLKGQYTYQLAFRLHKSGETVHIVRGFASTERSATAEADLEEGTYQVFLQISGTRRPWIPKVEDVVKENWLHRREKLLRIGLSHDLAHAKGRIPEPAKATAKSDTKQESTQTKESSPGEKKVSGEEGKKDESKVEDLNPNPNYQDELMEDIKNDDDITAEKKAASEARTPGAEPGPADTKIEVTVESAKEEETEKSEDAWDATCVVGLRVFCHDTSATIKVVRPEPMDAVSAENKLDVDDPEKDAVSKNSGSNIDKVTVTITKKDKGTETEDTNTEEAKKDPTTEEAKPEETKTNASAVKVDRETKGPATKSETQPKEEQAPVATGKSTDGATAKVTAGPQDEDKITSHEELKADDTRTEKKEATIEESKTEEMGTEDGAKANDEATPSIDSSGTEGAKFTPESSGSENTDSPTRTK